MRSSKNATLAECKEAMLRVRLQQVDDESSETPHLRALCSQVRLSGGRILSLRRIIWAAFHGIEYSEVPVRLFSKCGYVDCYAPDHCGPKRVGKKFKDGV